MILATHEKLEIGKIYNDTLLLDAINKTEANQPWHVIREATREDWIRDIEESYGRVPLNPTYGRYFWEISTD